MAFILLLELSFRGSDINRHTAHGIITGSLQEPLARQPGDKTRSDRMKGWRQFDSLVAQVAQEPVAVKQPAVPTKQGCLLNLSQNMLTAM